LNAELNALAGCGKDDGLKALSKNASDGAIEPVLVKVESDSSETGGRQLTIIVDLISDPAPGRLNITGTKNFAGD